MDQNTFATYVSLAGSIATAVATFALFYVTNALVRETKKLADATSQPQIIATIRPNLWSLIHFDLEVSNTGNATAFDIKVKFDPTIEVEDMVAGKNFMPLQAISILKPNEKLSTYLLEARTILDKKFTVETSWSIKPNSETRECLTYVVDLSDYSGVSYLGSRDPIVQIADQIKKFREDWRNVLSGSKKLQVDSHDRMDREMKFLSRAKRSMLTDRILKINWWDRTASRRERFERLRKRKK